MSRNYYRTCVIIDPPLAQLWQRQDVFDALQQMPGTVYKTIARRKTFAFQYKNHTYFAKLHWGVGWREIFKNLFQARLPIVGAKNEWRALQRLQHIGVRSLHVAAYGQSGWNPAQQTSFLVTHALIDTISLEKLCQSWHDHPPSVLFKRRLLTRVADIARRLHENGINHRDFYLCHFLLTQKNSKHADEPGTLYLIDLHRAQCRRRVPTRWRVKDISGLYFSAFNVGLTQRDVYRFMMHYTQKPLRQCLDQNKRFWHRVKQKALRLSDREHKQRLATE